VDSKQLTIEEVDQLAKNNLLPTIDKIDNRLHEYISIFHSSHLPLTPRQKAEIIISRLMSSDEKEDSNDDILFMATSALARYISDIKINCMVKVIMHPKARFGKPKNRDERAFKNVTRQISGLATVDHCSSELTFHKYSIQVQSQKSMILGAHLEIFFNENFNGQVHIHKVRGANHVHMTVKHAPMWDECSEIISQNL
jgi:hypothetical protein